MLVVIGTEFLSLIFYPLYYDIYDEEIEHTELYCILLKAPWNQNWPFLFYGILQYL